MNESKIALKPEELMKVLHGIYKDAGVGGLLVIGGVAIGIGIPILVASQVLNPDKNQPLIIGGLVLAGVMALAGCAFRAYVLHLNSTTYLKDKAMDYQANKGVREGRTLPKIETDKLLSQNRFPWVSGGLRRSNLSFGVRRG